MVMEHSVKETAYVDQLNAAIKENTEEYFAKSWGDASGTVYCRTVQNMEHI